MASTWTLHIQAGDDSPTRVLDLGSAPVRVGRGIQCEVRLNQVGLGDVQCLIRRRGDEWSVQPVGPPGRIWVDNRPADNQRSLPVGGELRVGRATLTIHASDPQGAGPGSFDAPITIDVSPALAEPVIVLAPPEPVAPPPPPLAPEPVAPEPIRPVDAEPAAGNPDDRVRRWQNRLEQRDQWLKDRQDEKRWEARWKAAGETLRARTTPPTSPVPPPAGSVPPVAAPDPTASLARPLPSPPVAPRRVEPRPVFGPSRRGVDRDRPPETPRVPVRTGPDRPRPAPTVAPVEPIRDLAPPPPEVIAAPAPPEPIAVEPPAPEPIEPAALLPATIEPIEPAAIEPEPAAVEPLVAELKAIEPEPESEPEPEFIPSPPVRSAQRKPLGIANFVRTPAPAAPTEPARAVPTAPKPERVPPPVILPFPRSDARRSETPRFDEELLNPVEPPPSVPEDEELLNPVEPPPSVPESVAAAPTPAAIDPLVVDFADVEAVLAELTPRPEPTGRAEVGAVPEPTPVEPAAVEVVLPEPVAVVPEPVILAPAVEVVAEPVVEVAPEPIAPSLPDPEPVEAPRPKRPRTAPRIKPPAARPPVDAGPLASPLIPDPAVGSPEVAARRRDAASMGLGSLAFPGSPPLGGTGPQAVGPAPEVKAYPTARSIFEAQGSRAIGDGATPRAGESARPRRVPEPTEAVRPEGWSVPFALGWVPALGAVVALGGFAVGLAGLWVEDSSSGNIALKLATRSVTAHSPVVDVQAIPKSAWWRTTASHLAAWALALERVGNGEDRSADARVLEADARAVSPLGARARFVTEPVAGQEADLAASIRLGPTRDVVTLTAMAHRLRREDKREAAIRAYQTAFRLAAATARSTLSRPVFRPDSQVNRYALPHSALLDPIARDMVAAGDWTPEEWAEATPDFGPALLAIAAAVREKDPAAAERRLEAVCRGSSRPLDPAFEEPEHQAAVAEALAERGRWTDAVAQYRLAIDGETRDLDRRVWWFNLAEVAHRGGDDALRDRAIEAAKGSDLADEVTQRAANAYKNAPEPAVNHRNR